MNKLRIINPEYSGLRIKNFIKNNRGTTLFMSLLILSGVLVVSLGAASLMLSGIKQGKTQIDSTKAYFAAEAGAERILWEIRKNGFNISGCNDNNYINFDTSACVADEQSYNLSNDASYSVLFIDDSNDYILESIGDFQDVKRSVEIKYAK